MAGIVDLKVKQGATTRVTLEYTNAAGVPIDLTGYRARMQVRKRAKYSLPVLMELNTENGGLVLGPVPGEIHIKMVASKTSLLSRNAVYDLHLISQSDPEDVIYVFGGNLVVRPGVTE